VTFFASKVAFTLVAFTPVAFWEVVVVPLVVVGIIVFPIKVLLVGTIPLADADDEFVLFCCANTSMELVYANPNPIERTVIDNVRIVIFIEFMSIIENTTMALMLIVLNYEDRLLIHSYS
jgi:hypothetical protein